MAYKIYCDRCRIDIGEGIRTCDNELMFTKTRNTRFGIGKRMHLCNNCLKDFDKFMLEKQEEEKQEEEKQRENK